MKRTRIVAVFLVGIILVSGLACGEGGESEPTLTPTPTSVHVIKPTVGTIPQGWYLSDEEPYGTYVDPDGTEWGEIEYTDTEDGDYILIYYGDVPSDLKGRETDSDALISKAIEWSIMSELDETGTVVAAGQTAGYTKKYGSAGEYNEMEIAFIVGSTCFDIYTEYYATTANEAQVMSIINSISIE